MNQLWACPNLLPSLQESDMSSETWIQRIGWFVIVSERTIIYRSVKKATLANWCETSVDKTCTNIILIKKRNTMGAVSLQTWTDYYYTLCILTVVREQHLMARAFSDLRGSFLEDIIASSEWLLEP